MKYNNAKIIRNTKDVTENKETEHRIMESQHLCQMTSLIEKAPTNRHVLKQLLLYSINIGYRSGNLYRAMLIKL